MRQFRFLLAASLLTLLSLAACKSKGKSSKDLLLKKWKMTAMTAPMPDSMKQVYLDKSVMEFRADGSYSISGAPDMTQNGKYKMSDDGKTITFTFANRDDVNDVNELTSEKLVVTSKADGYRIEAVPAK